MSNATTLTGPGPRLPTDFRQSLGSLDWEKLKPDVKLSLWHSYVAKQQSPPMSEADRIALELQAKYGDAISAEEKMSAQERLRFALASGTAKPPQAPIDPTPIPPELVGERKLEAMYLAKQRDNAVHRLQGYHADDPARDRTEREIAYLDMRLRGFRS